MQLIADLQLHSKYSRAVSPEMVIPKMYEWNLKKGIGLLATGDWTHPLWVRELKLQPRLVSAALILSTTSKFGANIRMWFRRSFPLWE